MSDKEMRELDQWLHTNVFGFGDEYFVVKRGFYYRPHAAGYTSRASEAGRYTFEEAKSREYIHGQGDDVTIDKIGPQHYTTDPAAALTVLKKCAGIHEPISIYKLVSEDVWSVKASIDGEPNRDIHVHGATLELAICLFAKQLFRDEKV